MFVPDSFGGRSPEWKAADHLRNLFTFIAFRIVLSQLEGRGTGASGSYNAQQYNDLLQYWEANPRISNGDEWLAGLCNKNPMLGVRLMEVRTAYCKEDFEWDNAKRVAVREMDKANQRILSQQAEASFLLSMESQDRNDKTKS
ncbi:hypothetical protein WJX73_000157 [Symbiochloris irregularis]|uniref:Uncharacterized protein n=1 Tax=Symbiochloris irregularis TaxID=706552 RepID=A0AAW1PGG2_9CHLO